MNPDVGGFILGNTFPRTAPGRRGRTCASLGNARHRQVLERSSAVHLLSDHLAFRRWTAAWLAEQKTGPTDRFCHASKRSTP